MVWQGVSTNSQHCPSPGSLAHPQQWERERQGPKHSPDPPTSLCLCLVAMRTWDLGLSLPSKDLPGPPAFPVPGGSEHWTSPPLSC